MAILIAHGICELWQLKEKYTLTDVYDLHEVLVMKTMNRERAEEAQQRGSD